MKLKLVWLRDSCIPLFMMFLAASAGLLWVDFSIRGKTEEYLVIQVRSSVDGPAVSVRELAEEDEQKAGTTKVLRAFLFSEPKLDLSLLSRRELRERMALSQQGSVQEMAQAQVADIFALALELNDEGLLEQLRPILTDESKRDQVEKWAVGQQMIFYNNLALSFHRQENFSMALRYFLRANRLRPNGWSNLGISTIYAHSGDKAESAQHLSEALKLSEPALHHLLYLAMGNELARSQNHNLSLDFFEKSARLRPGFLPAKLGQGEALRKLGRLAEAESMYNQILLNHRANPQVHYDYAILLKKMGRLRDAIGELHSALLLDQSSTDVRRQLGNVYLDLKEHEKALEQFVWLQKRSPGEPILLYWVGKTQLELKKFKEAEASLRLAIEKRGGDYPDAWMKIGELHLAQDRKDLAAKVFSDVIKLRPEFAAPYYQLAQLQKDSAAKASVLDLMKKAVELKPASALYRRRLADLLMESGNQQQALAELREAMKLEPENINVQVRMGEMLSRMDRYKEGNDLFRAVLKRRPNKSIVWYNLGLNLYRTGELVDANSAFTSSLALADSDETVFRAKVLRRKSLCYKKLKQPTKAIDALNNAIEVEGNYLPARLDLAEILWATTQSTKAREELLTVLRLDNQNCRAIKLARGWRLTEFSNLELNKKCNTAQEDTAQ